MSDSNWSENTYEKENFINFPSSEVEEGENFTRNPSSSRKYAVKSYLLIILGCFLLLAVSILITNAVFHFPFSYHNNRQHDLQWIELAPGSGVLHANISLPLDYTNPDAGNLTIALAKIPATSSPGDKLGSILINPGGPGGSGTNFAYGTGKKISDIVDGRYDIIGFDPRGVNWTSNQFFCMKPEQRNKLSFNNLLSYHNNDDVSYGELLAWSKLEGEACSRSDGGQYISTALVATDMLHISERLGDEKLNYWGVSYGTALGNTFAQMFPDRVGRMIVDGVIDGEDYYRGTFLTTFANTDGETQGFFDACSVSDQCALNGTSDQIREQIEDLMQSLKFEPRLVLDNENIDYVTYSDFKKWFFSSMYAPWVWPAFANHTDQLLSGNATGFYEAYVKPDRSSDEDDSGKATRCGDGINSHYVPTLSNIDALKAHTAKLEKSTSLWSDLWFRFGSCYEYKRRPVLVWDGPFQKVNASMLLIGNTYDPVTPIGSARKMSTFYTNGIVLHQDGYGHGSFAQKSNCTHNKVKQWFLEGILPVNNTICPVDEALFEGKLTIKEEFIPMLF